MKITNVEIIPIKPKQGLIGFADIIFEDQLLEILSDKTGSSPKRAGEGYIAKCPSHEDHSPSLSISEGPDQSILIHCHAGCETKIICECLGISFSDLFQPSSIQNFSQTKIEYIYVNDQGKAVYKKTRIEPGKNGAKKNFSLKIR
jgi:hypothetical protein